MHNTDPLPNSQLKIYPKRITLFQIILIWYARQVERLKYRLVTHFLWDKLSRINMMIMPNVI